MPRRRKRSCVALLGMIILLIVGIALPIFAAEGNLVLQPEVVTISTFFSGVQMNITGDLPPDREAVLCIRGKMIEEEMMRKALHWDLWMNSGEVDIYQSPSFYIALSSDSALLTAATKDVPWGYAALEKKAKFVGRLKPIEDDTIFWEFVQLKERDKLYHLYPGGLKITQPEPDRWQIQASVPLPSRIKPGNYQVALYIIKGGKVEERYSTTFEVKMVGLPATLNAMAEKHGVMYGFMAVVLAVVVGMLVGLVFHRK